MRKPPHSRAACTATTLVLLTAAAPAFAGEPPSAPASSSAPGSSSGPAPSAPAARAVVGSDAVAIDPANLLLFAVDLNGLTLTDGLAAYGNPEDPLLPVGELTRLLEADVDVFPGERRIVGRLGEARRPMLVDLKAGVARVDSTEVKLTDEDVAVTASEMYLRASAFQKLFRAKLTADAQELAIHITATEKFPVQARLERLANRPDASGIGRGLEEALDVLTPYRLALPPSFDVVLGLGLSSNDNSRRYDVRFAGDLLFANYQGYVGSDENGRPSSARLLFERKSLTGGLLGPLHARDLSFGDVFTPGMALGARSGTGRGISLSTVPLDQTNIFNRVDLRGELPPGYDVELYVNEVLRGSTNQAPNGRYEFLNVPLSPGVNVVRIVTYSPRGERSETTRVINVAGGMLRRGQGTFEFGAVEQDKSLLQFRNLTPPSPDDVPIAAANGVRVVGTVNYGLLQFLTVSGSAAVTPRVDGGSTWVGAVGARTSLFGVATQFDLARDDEGGQAGSIGLAGQFRGASAILRHAAYAGGFVDENNFGADPSQRLRNRTELTLDSSLALRGRMYPVSLRAIRDGYTDGSYDLGLSGRASSSIRGVLLSTSLDYKRRVSRQSSPVESLSGYLAASTFRGFTWQIRATLDYDILPEFRPRLVSVTADRRINDLWSLRFAASQPLDDWKGFDLLASSIFVTRYGDLSLTGEYDNRDHDWRLSAQFSFGLGYDPLGPGYVIDRQGPGGGGSMVLNAFYDANGDGVRQPDEEPAPDVAIDGGAHKGILTDKNGRAYVTGMGAGPTSLASVGLDKLENTSVSSPPGNVRVGVHPGSVAVVDYPLRPTGDVMVNLMLQRDDGKKVGLSAVRVQLVPKSGSAVVATSEFDGSAIFNQVPAGVYRLQLDPEQARKLRMRLTEEKTVEIKGDGSFTPDVTTQVVFDPAPEGPPAATQAGPGQPDPGPVADARAK